MRAERDIKAANLSHHDLAEKIRRDTARMILECEPAPSPQAQELLDAMAGALIDVRTMVDAALHGVGAEIDGQNIPLTDLYLKPQTEAEQLFSLDQPSLRALSHILRHKELWPKGFRWHYSSCSSCAMGLAWEIWDLGFISDVYTNLRRASSLFQMPLVESCTIFGGYIPHDPNNIENGAYQAQWTVDPAGGSYMGHVTPEMVADKIDEYLAGVK